LRAPPKRGKKKNDPPKKKNIGREGGRPSKKSANPGAQEENPEPRGPGKANKRGPGDGTAFSRHREGPTWKARGGGGGQGGGHSFGIFGRRAEPNRAPLDETRIAGGDFGFRGRFEKKKKPFPEKNHRGVFPGGGWLLPLFSGANPSGGGGGPENGRGGRAQRRGRDFSDWGGLLGPTGRTGGETGETGWGGGQGHPRGGTATGWGRKEKGGGRGGPGAAAWRQRRGGRDRRGGKKGGGPGGLPTKPFLEPGGTRREKPLPTPWVDSRGHAGGRERPGKLGGEGGGGKRDRVTPGRARPQTGRRVSFPQGRGGRGNLTGKKKKKRGGGGGRVWRKALFPARGPCAAGSGGPLGARGQKGHCSRPGTPRGKAL